MPVSSPATDTPVGSTIRRIRKSKGVFIRELAERIGVASATVSRWERGREFCPFDRREQIAVELDFDPALLGEPSTVEVTAQEQSLLTAIRRMPPHDLDALCGLLADFQPAQEHAPC